MGLARAGGPRRRTAAHGRHLNYCSGVTSADFVHLLLQLGAMLITAVALGLLARRLHQPAIVGEMFAGIILGVTVFGAIAPNAYDWLFVDNEQATTVRDAAVKLGMLFFLYVAGSEVDLADVRKIGRQALTIGLVGTLLPIAAGVALVYATPVSLWGEVVGIDRLPFSLFIGMNLANSANPVLARILMDLGIMRSRIAAVVMTATIVDDLVNWTLYAVILGSIASSAGGDSRPIALNLVLVALLFVVVLVGGRWLAPRLVRFAARFMAGATGYVTVVSITVIAASALAEAIGVHAFLGAFLAGVAFSGVAVHDRSGGHEAFTAIALGFFAPIFFVSMAMSVDFIEHFSPVLVAVLIVAALATKLASVLIGVRAAGLPLDRTAWAMAWGLNARGATGIVLAATGRAAGLIDDTLFVGLVVMCIVTSLLAGPMMSVFLPGEEEARALEPDPDERTPATA